MNQLKKKQLSEYRYSLSNTQKQKSFLLGKKLSKHKHLIQKSHPDLTQNFSNFKDFSLNTQKIKKNKKKQKQNKPNNKNITKNVSNIKRNSSSISSYQLAVLKQKRSNGSVLINQKSNGKIKNTQQKNHNIKVDKLDQTVKKQKVKIKQKDREKCSALSNYSTFNQPKSSIKNKKNDNYRSMSANEQDYVNIDQSKQKKKDKKASLKYNSSCIDLAIQNEFKKYSQKNNLINQKKHQIQKKNKQVKKKQSFTFANIQIKNKKTNKDISPSKRKQSSYQAQYTKNTNIENKQIRVIDPLNYIKSNNLFYAQKSVTRPSNFMKKKSKSKPEISITDLNSTKIKQKNNKKKQLSLKVGKKILKKQKQYDFDLKELEQAPYFLIMKHGQTPQSELQFPINKYQKYYQQGPLQKTVKNKQLGNKKSKSKSQSRSQSQSRKNSHYLVNNKSYVRKNCQNDLVQSREKQYNQERLMINASSLFCYSDSQEIIDKSDSDNQNQQNKNIKKILDFEKSNQQPTKSINLNQIRAFQNQNKKQKDNLQLQESYKPRLFKKSFECRHLIIKQISDDYCLLSKVELQFLASVIFIQRKWRQRKSTSMIKTIIHDILKPNMEEQQPKLQQNIKQQNKTPFKQGNKSEKIQINLQQQQLKQESKNNALNASPIMLYHQNLTSRLQENINFFSSTLTKYRRQDDIFPQVTYLQIKKQLYKSQYLKNLQQLQSNFLSCSLSQSQQFNLKQKSQNFQDGLKSQRNQFEYKKQKLKQEYKEKLLQLSNNKKLIKQGCMKYIQCINQTKSLIKLEGIRRVSSEDGMMTLLYKKIFKLDYQLRSESSSDSQYQQKSRLQSFDARNKQILQIQNCLKGNNRVQLMKKKEKKVQEIKEQFFGVQTQQIIKKELNNSSQIKGNIQINEKSQQVSFQKQRIKTDNQSTRFNISKLLTISQSQLFSTQLVQNISKRQMMPSDKKSQISQQQSSKNQYLSQSNQEDLFCQDQHNKHISMQNSFQNQNLKHEERQIFLEDDQFSLDNVSFEDIYFKMDSIKINDQNSGFQFNQIANFNYKFPTYSKQEQNNKTLSFTSRKYSQLYIHQFLLHITESSKTLQKLILNLNKQQGFSPISYLNFLRTFQLPEDQYVPIIQNQKFIEWEQQWLSRNDTKSYNQMKMIEDRETTQQILNQGLTIYHRSLFQLIGNEFQKYRVFGQKGKPFPWQNNYSTENIQTSLTQRKIKRIIFEIQKRIQERLGSECGIIQQNHALVISQEDLEQLHDKNQDRIIQMLENELQDSPNNWYQIDEHNLQIKIQISEIVWEQMFQEFIFQTMSLALNGNIDINER